MENSELKEITLIDSKELIQKLKISETTLWKLRKSGRIPYVSTGGTYRYEYHKVLQALTINKVD